MATHSSTLAWKIPWTEEPGRLQSMGSQRVGHNWATLLTYMRLRFGRVADEFRTWPFGNHGVEACGSSGAEVAEPLALSTSVPTANSRDKGCQALQTFYEPTSVPCILKIKRSLLIQVLFCWEQPVYDFYCNQKFWPIQLYHQYKRDQQFFLPS